MISLVSIVYLIVLTTPIQRETFFILFDTAINYRTLSSRLLTPLCQAHDKNSSTNKICLNYTIADFIT